MGDTFFFGFLDCHVSRSEAQRSRGQSSQSNLGRTAWRWQSFLFILKNGEGDARRLVWSRHPTDARALGSIPIDKIRSISPLDTPDEEAACLLLDYEGPNGASEALALRAPSPNS